MPGPVSLAYNATSMLSIIRQAKLNAHIYQQHRGHTASYNLQTVEMFKQEKNNKNSIEVIKTRISKNKTRKNRPNTITSAYTKLFNYTKVELTVSNVISSTLVKM